MNQFFFQDYCILCLKVILRHSICLRHYFLWQVLWCLYQFWNFTNPKICIPDQLQLWLLKHLMSRERVWGKKNWTHKYMWLIFFVRLINRIVCISLKNKLYFCHSLKKMKVIHLCKKRTYLPIACIPFFKIIILQEYNKDSIHFSC